MTPAASRMNRFAVPAIFSVAAVAITGCCGGDPAYWTPPANARTVQAEDSQELVDASFFAGQWSGRGCQTDGICWTIRVQIAPDEQGNPTGKIAYPSVPCAARLEFTHWEAGDVAVFRERFDDPGACVPDGWLRLSLNSRNQLNFVWSFPDGRVDAGTTLDRVR